MDGLAQQQAALIICIGKKEDGSYAVTNDNRMDRAALIEVYEKVLATLKEKKDHIIMSSI